MSPCAVSALDTWNIALCSMCTGEFARLCVCMENDMICHWGLCASLQCQRIKLDWLWWVDYDMDNGMSNELVVTERKTKNFFVVVCDSS